MTTAILSCITIETCFDSENIIYQVTYLLLTEQICKTCSFKIFHHAIYTCEEPVENNTLTSGIKNCFFPFATNCNQNIHYAECCTVSIPYGFNTLP